MASHDEMIKEDLLNQIDDLKQQLHLCKRANMEAQETIKKLLANNLELQEQLGRGQ